MKKIPYIKHLYLCIIQVLVMMTTLSATAQEDFKPESLTEPLYKPFIERYILDELKSLRQDQNTLQVALEAKLADSKLESSDRVIRYAADTTNVIFYIITGAASILVMLGWRSIHDIKFNIESTTAKKVAELTLEYESRLNTIENSLKERSEQIVATQKNMSDSNLIHSLWMRAALEKGDMEKIKIYDQILDINPSDIEALTYKADTLLEIDEDTWALSLTNQALDQDNSYALAYWQRACARAKLEQESQALEDIKKAIELSPSFQSELSSEPYFERLKQLEDFKALIS